MLSRGIRVLVHFFRSWFTCGCSSCSSSSTTTSKNGTNMCISRKAEETIEHIKTKPQSTPLQYRPTWDPWSSKCGFCTALLSGQWATQISYSASSTLWYSISRRNLFSANRGRNASMSSISCIRRPFSFCSSCMARKRRPMIKNISELSRLNNWI